MKKLFHIKLVLFFAVSPFIFHVKAQDIKYDTLVAAGIKQIYDIKFHEAETTFRKLIADYPDKPAGRFFLSMIDWWKILLDPDNESYDELFFQKLEDVIFNATAYLLKTRTTLTHFSSKEVL